MRTFLAVEVPQQERRTINDLILNAAKRELAIKWVRFENLHITLKFLGEIDEKMKTGIVPVVESICRSHSSFQVKLEGLGCFPNPENPRVLWVGVQEGSKELCAIASALEEGLADFGFKKEKRFHPHLTIGRVKKRCRLDDILTKNISCDPFVVASLVLFKSTLKPEGPIYDRLFSFMLQ